MKAKIKYHKGEQVINLVLYWKDGVTTVEYNGSSSNLEQNTQSPEDGLAEVIKNLESFPDNHSIEVEIVTSC